MYPKRFRVTVAGALLKLNLKVPSCSCRTTSQRGRARSSLGSHCHTFIAHIRARKGPRVLSPKVIIRPAPANRSAVQASAPRRTAGGSARRRWRDGSCRIPIPQLVVPVDIHQKNLLGVIQGVGQGPVIAINLIATDPLMRQAARACWTIANANWALV
jgi:hypothetical protein